MWPFCAPTKIQKSTKPDWNTQIETQRSVRKKFQIAGLCCGRFSLWSAARSFAFFVFIAENRMKNSKCLPNERRQLRDQLTRSCVFYPIKRWVCDRDGDVKYEVYSKCGKKKSKGEKVINKKSKIELLCGIQKKIHIYIYISKETTRSEKGIFCVLRRRFVVVVGVVQLILFCVFVRCCCFCLFPVFLWLEKYEKKAEKLRWEK